MATFLAQKAVTFFVPLGPSCKMFLRLLTRTIRAHFVYTFVILSQRLFLFTHLPTNSRTGFGEMSPVWLLLASFWPNCVVLLAHFLHLAMCTKTFGSHWIEKYNFRACKLGHSVHTSPNEIFTKHIFNIPSHSNASLHTEKTSPSVRAFPLSSQPRRLGGGTA